MIEYRPLENTPLKVLHKAFLEAFSDYFVAMKITPAQFRKMNQVRGVDYAASVGAFDGARLVGFTFNGLGAWNGRATAYDAGTAVIKEYRGRGLAGGMFGYTLPALKKLGVKRYLLEVITKNGKAFRIYRKCGFKTTRRLVCVKLQLDQLRLKPGGGAKIRTAAPGRWGELRALAAKDLKNSFRPSWQNSWDSILRLPGNFKVLGAYLNGRCAGYGVVAPASGSVPQLWVNSAQRGQGLGSQLLAGMAGLARERGALTWLNIDEKSAGTLRFVKKAGFK